MEAAFQIHSLDTALVRQPEAAEAEPPSPLPR
jgi:hypothetical protein